MSKIRRTNRYAIQFDGVTDLIRIPIGPDRSKLSFGQDVVNAAEPESPFSVSFWFHTDDVAGSGDDNGHFIGIVDRNPASATHAQHEWLLFRGVRQIQFFLYDPENDSGDPDQSGTAVGSKYRFGNSDSSRGLGARIVASTNNVLVDNTWHHVIATYDGSKTKEGQKIYLDGVLMEALSLSEKSTNPTIGNAVAGQFPYEGLRNGNVPVTIGAFHAPAPETSDFSMLGSMADVCIFNKALSLSEVQEVYNGGKVKNMTQASTYNNLLAWWKMGDDQDATGPAGIKDYINSNHGQLEGDAFIGEDLRLGSDIESDPRTAGIHIHQNFGKTRGPKSPLQYTQNLVGNTNYIIPSSASNELGANGWDIANESKDKGLSTENQRHMHLLLDSSTSASGNKNVRIAVLGYISAFGIWSELLNHDGVELPGVQTALQDGTAEYYVFDILGVDRVLFFPTNNNADDISDWQLRAAFSSF